MTDQINEVLTTQQRIKKKMIMRRQRAKIEMARRRARRKLAGSKKVVERAMRAARDVIRARVAGKRGEKYHTLGPAEKREIDILAAKRKKAVKKIARRLIAKVRKKEFARFKSFYSGSGMKPMHTTESSTEQHLQDMLVESQQIFLTEDISSAIDEMVVQDHDEMKLFFIESLALENGDEEMALLRVELAADLMEIRGTQGTRQYDMGGRRYNIATDKISQTRRTGRVKSSAMRTQTRGGERARHMTVRRDPKSGQVRRFQVNPQTRAFRNRGAVATQGKLGGSHITHGSSTAGRRVARRRTYRPQGK